MAEHNRERHCLHLQNTMANLVPAQKNVLVMAMVDPLCLIAIPKRPLDVLALSTGALRANICFDGRFVHDRCCATILLTDLTLTSSSLPTPPPGRANLQVAKVTQSCGQRVCWKKRVVDASLF